MIQMKHVFVAAMMAAAGSGPARAQDAATITEILLIDETVVEEYGSARAWIDAHVRGADDERIGRVHDLLLGADNQVVALAVGVGGFLGIDEKYVAIPLSEATLETVDEHIEFATSYTRDQLRAAVDR